MEKRNYLILFVILVEIVLIAYFSIVCQNQEEFNYYAEKSNYISVTGTVSYISFTEDNKKLYVGFATLNPKCDDNTFKIVGQNLDIAMENGIETKLKVGDEITFITAPKYLGDGYVMPIVAISVHDELLLSFNEGYQNFLNWLKEK